MEPEIIMQNDNFIEKESECIQYAKRTLQLAVKAFISCSTLMLMRTLRFLILLDTLTIAEQFLLELGQSKSSNWCGRLKLTGRLIGGTR